MNKVVLIGRLTKDPELNHAASSGTAVCRFSLAVARQFKKDETDFINCIAFGKTGETIAQYLTKGKQLALSGRLQTGSYDDKDGVKRYTTDVIVDNFEFIGNSNNDNNQSGAQVNSDTFGEMTFDNAMTPVNDGDMPF